VVKRPAGIDGKSNRPRYLSGRPAKGLEIMSTPPAPVGADDLRALEKNAERWRSAIASLCQSIAAAKRLLDQEPSFVVSGQLHAQKISDALLRGEKSEAFLLHILQDRNELLRLVTRDGGPRRGAIEVIELATANELQPIRFRGKTVLTATEMVYSIGRLLDLDCGNSRIFEWEEMKSENREGYPEWKRQRDCKRLVDRIADITPKLLDTLGERIATERIRAERWIIDRVTLQNPRQGGDLIPRLLAGPDKIELTPSELALLEAHLKQPISLSAIQRDKQTTGKSETNEQRKRLTLIRDFNRNLQAAIPSLSGGDDTEPTTGETVPPKRRGPKKADYNTVQREAALAAEWDRARDAGTYKVDFARDKGMKTPDLQKLLNRVYARKNPSE
jgi:hypothetical protein